MVGDTPSLTNNSVPLSEIHTGPLNVSRLPSVVMSPDRENLILADDVKYIFALADIVGAKRRVPNGQERQESRQAKERRLLATVLRHFHDAVDPLDRGHEGGALQFAQAKDRDSLAGRRRARPSI